MEEMLRKLTAVQREAVTHVEGPLLVLAGPGSGKTRVITHRVGYLISRGIQPREILAITFTNKAADEMRQRLAAMRLRRGSTICTFHSLAARLLREFADKAGLVRNFTIYDQADQVAALRDVLKTLEIDRKNFPPGKMLGHISNCKNDLETPEQYAARHSDFKGKIIARIYTAYQKQLEKNAALDFDDLLMRFALLLQKDQELRDLLNRRYKYVLVDEYQDTNHCQYQMARGLTLNHGNLCVTGDPDQSIYGWRGADIGNILAFEEDYPQAKVVRLEENFRSIPEVLNLANSLIRFNKQRKEKKLFTSIASGVLPELIEYDDEDDEAHGMAQAIKELRQGGLEYRQIAVFYRVNWMSRVLEEALRQEKIPYQIVRGIEFFQRKEIKDLLGYMKFLSNPADRVSLKRIINRPTRGIGETSVKKLFQYCDNTGRDLWETLTGIDQVEVLGTAAKTRIKKFVTMVNQWRAKMEAPVAELMQTVYDQSGLMAVLAAEKTEDSAEYAEELINDAAKYDATTEAGSLDDYLQQIALFSDTDAYDEQAGVVSLMTLHAAKGLEFPAVIIIGVEEGLIPHSRSMDTDKELEEERRLLFVGITRAQQRLFISYANNRTVHGANQATIRSGFLRGLEGLEFRRESDFEDDWDFDNDFSRKIGIDDDEPAPGFKTGELVRHGKFGIGRIQHTITSGDNPRVVVNFNSAGQKTLALKYAKLEKLD